MKGLEKTKTLRKKFQQLNEENSKKQFENELHDFMMENKTTNLDVNKKVVCNNSSKELSQQHIGDDKSIEESQKSGTPF